MDGRLRELDFGDDEDVTSTRSELEADPMFSQYIDGNRWLSVRRRMERL